MANWKNKSTEDLFWEKVNKNSGSFGEDGNYPTECWQWLAYIKPDGYTLFWFNKRMQHAHIYSYRLHHQDHDPNLDIDHLCRNRSCVNPDHLQQITHKDNFLRGIGPTAINAAKTHCDHGHALERANLYITKSGRACHECRRIVKNQKRWQDKTHCRNGHIFTQENTIIKNDSKRCRICLKSRAHRAYINRKQKCGS